MRSVVDSSPSLAARADGVVVTPGDPVYLEIPRTTATGYLTHGLFRYAGKLAPPLMAFLLDEYTSQGALVVDPMCGGGTTAIEAISSNRRSINFDINPVSRLITEGVTQRVAPNSMGLFAARISAESDPMTPPALLEEFFSPEAFGLIHHGLNSATCAAESVLILSIVRTASFANTKKINTVVDKTKQPRDPRSLLFAAAQKFDSAYRAMSEVDSGLAEVRDAPATSTGHESSSVDFVLLHPPYLTNTAFSEVTQLQLMLLGHDPKKLRSKELAYRGSYFHVTNGLRKYLVGWSQTFQEAARMLRPGGHVAVIVGDGRIDGVRIPIGAITEEFASDIGLKLRLRAVHVLNNHTGMTLSHRMSSHHVLVFEK